MVSPRISARFCLSAALLKPFLEFVLFRHSQIAVLQFPEVKNVIVSRQWFSSSAEDAQVVAVHKHPATLLPGDLPHDTEILKMLDRLCDSWRRDAQPLCRRGNADDRLLLKQLVDPERGCGRASEILDPVPIGFEQREDLARRL